MTSNIPRCWVHVSSSPSSPLQVQMLDIRLIFLSSEQCWEILDTISSFLLSCYIFGSSQFGMKWARFRCGKRSRRGTEAWVIYYLANLPWIIHKLTNPSLSPMQKQSLKNKPFSFSQWALKSQAKDENCLCHPPPPRGFQGVVRQVYTVFCGFIRPQENILSRENSASKSSEEM